MLKIPKKLQGEWQREYKVISGYFGDFYIAELKHGGSMLQSFRSITDAAIYARDLYGSRVLEEVIFDVPKTS